MSVREAPTRSGASKAPKATDAQAEPGARQPNALPRPKSPFDVQPSPEGETTVVTPPERTTVAASTGPEATAILPAADRTQVEAAPEDPATARERRRAERDRALGTRRPVPEPLGDDQPSAAPVARTAVVRSTDKFAGSLGLFLLRVVTAVIIGLHGFDKVLDIQAVQVMLANTVIPEPVIMSFVLAGAEVAIALALLLGLFTRLAGFGLAAIGIGALVFVQWISNPFVGNLLVGELELLLAGVGVLFLFVGAGGWSVDAAFRRRRVAAAF